MKAKESERIDEFIRKHQELSLADTARVLKVSYDVVARRRSRLGLPKKQPGPKASVQPVREQVDLDTAKKQYLDSKRDLEKKYKYVLQELETKEKELRVMLALKEPPNATKILPITRDKDSEATAFVIVSDTHIEEPVYPEQVSGLNEYNLEISKARFEHLFRTALRLTNIFEKDIKIPNMVLALLGDMISGSIHDELAESNLLPPTDAILRCRDYLISGIEFLLKNSNLNLYVPCHTGNHGRSTKERRVATESGNSLERLMYAGIAAHFRNESRIKFHIAEGYHSYYEVYDATIQFHHGHAIKYQGGVGGITIPVRKAIAQWQRGRRSDLSVFGHFHTYMDGGTFVANGSMIGYNAYALSIKAEFEKPKQAFFLWDRVRGKTVVAPILFE